MYLVYHHTLAVCACVRDSKKERRHEWRRRRRRWGRRRMPMCAARRWWWLAYGRPLVPRSCRIYGRRNPSTNVTITLHYYLLYYYYYRCDVSASSPSSSCSASDCASAWRDWLTDIVSRMVRVPQPWKNTSRGRRDFNRLALLE